jgi:transposase-like protein
MSKFYSPKEKARAIQLLIESLGDTHRTAQQTGIPERTLRRWRSEISPDTVLIADDFHESVERIARQRYVRIRNHLLDIVEILANKTLENPDLMTDYIMDYSRTLTRLAAAEELASARSFTLVILWEDPEGYLKLSPDDMEFSYAPPIFSRRGV